ncbi:helix-turn-helix domain-containing protein [Chryseobacterium herbae]|uniref:Helix-turn-helix domain-containing protein n=1 Tax=Chryseobacterium herbae TaxID=2976476 RepID=A0ABT2ITB8_9FLAO|nr:helix-turn-helix domain-containing protein [Chryseobacterium sp. pc1-10]MCT2562078.1 helix-turn-helix domain-containing protein [Chryseobacterium sp. pc1-10]
MTKQPNYRKIYEDVLKFKFPEKTPYCQSILKKEKLSTLDVVKINAIIFSKKNENTFAQNQKHKSYDLPTILEILDYQKKHKLNNSQVAKNFKLSRNTVAKWKNMFLVQQSKKEI